ncbi:hypothetical protein ACM66B_004900 [Microbotryomycetes sp. NB124-2]
MSPITPSHNSGSVGADARDGDGMPVDLTKLPFPSVLYRPLPSVLEPVPAATAAGAQFVGGSASLIAPGMSSSAPRKGTETDPVIPKRRRRTTAHEQSILESAFQRNSRPDAHERSQLAAQLSGMTQRAVAVWMQNRRQKEKKEQSSFRGSSLAPSSAGSSPDMDTGDFDDLGSSSPSSRSTVAPPSSASIENATRLALQASEAVYKALPDNKENVNNSSGAAGNNNDNPTVMVAGRPTLPSVLCPVVPAPAAGPTQQSRAVDASSSAEAKMTHRAASTSVIAAKKHVRRRPLGSHAPLARKPSLSHAFNFPPSPPKLKTNAAKATAERPQIRRQGSSASLASLTRALKGSIFDQTQSSLESDTLNRARSWVDALSSRALGEGFEEVETKAPQPSQQAVETGASVERPTDASISQAQFEPAPTPVTKRLRARDELLQHMASDLPSSPASPAPFRAADEGNTRTAYRPPSRGVRLGFTESESAVTRAKRTTASMAATIEGSRAGGEATDALSALERKRAKIVGHRELVPAGANGSSMTTRPKQARRTSSSSSNQSRSRATNKKQQASSTIATTTSAKPAAATGPLTRPGYSATLLIDAATQELGRQRQASLTSAGSADVGNGSVVDPDSDMGDLSFSSTSTDNSVIVGTPKHDSAGFFVAAAGAHSKQDVLGGKVADVTSGARDDTERECAELLLGLGGGFH